MRLGLFLFRLACLGLSITVFAFEIPPASRATTQQPQVVLITGASRGIGWETAKRLARQGHHVYASTRSLNAALTQESEALPTLYLLQLDVTDDLSVGKAFKEIQRKEGHLDVLINNAGCAVFGPMEVVSIEQAKTMFDVNFFGTMRLMQAALPMMRERGNGLIINISSTSGIRPSPGWDIYGASKFAIEGLSEAVAAMVRHWNIRVVVVEPGTTATKFMQQSTVLGDRQTENTAVYSAFTTNALRWMQERLADGQKPEDVAAVISSIIASDHPHFRYQTSVKGTQTIARRHCDPTGDASINEQETLVKELWNGPLDAQTGSSYR